MLYGLSESDVAKLRNVIAAWDHYGPSAFQPRGRVFSGVHSIHGIMDDQLVFNSTSTATVSIYTGDGGNETDSGDDVEAFTWLLSTGKKLAAGSHVVCHQINGQWYVIASRECPVDI